MRSLLMSICVSLLAVNMPQELSAADDHIRLKAGVSVLTGVIGLEYQKDKIAVDLGWLPPSDTELAALGTTYKSESQTRLALGARYYMSPDTNGLFGALSFVLNDQGTFIVDLTKTPPTQETDGTHALYLTAGYRFLFGDRLDLTLGSGVGLALGLSKQAEALGADSTVPSIDIALGYTIK